MAETVWLPLVNVNVPIFFNTFLFKGTNNSEKENIRTKMVQYPVFLIASQKLGGGSGDIQYETYLQLKNVSQLLCFLALYLFLC